MEILITSKTRMGGQYACIGGLIIGSNEFVRLLNPGNWNQYTNTVFKIGDIWDIEFIRRPDIILPHNEDIIINSKRFVKQIENLAEYIIKSGVKIYKGSPVSIFDGKLGWTSNGGGYINKDDLPLNSVGFWVSDKDMEFIDKHYIYHSERIYIHEKKIPYVGFIEPIKIIKADTLIRISLARWWKPKDVEMEERCYLQLSGWFNGSVK